MREHEFYDRWSNFCGWVFVITLITCGFLVAIFGMFLAIIPIGSLMLEGYFSNKAKNHPEKKAYDLIPVEVRNAIGKSLTVRQTVEWWNSEALPGRQTPSQAWAEAEAVADWHRKVIFLSIAEIKDGYGFILNR